MKLVPFKRFQEAWKKANEVYPSQPEVWTVEGGFVAVGGIEGDNCKLYGDNGTIG